MKLNYVNLDEQQGVQTLSAQPEVVAPQMAAIQLPQQAPVQMSPAQVMPQQVKDNLFAPLKTEHPPQTSMEAATDRVNEVVTEVFSAAVVHTVSTDEGVRQGITDAAKSVIKSKSQTLTDAAETESTAQVFKKHEDACSGFGYEEQTTPKSLVKQMSGIAYVWNFLYIWLLGATIVFPITFLCRKVKVVVKHAWLAFVLALVVYLLVIGTPILISWLVSLK